MYNSYPQEQATSLASQPFSLFPCFLFFDPFYLLVYSFESQLWPFNPHVGTTLRKQWPQAFLHTPASNQLHTEVAITLRFQLCSTCKKLLYMNPIATESAGENPEESYYTDLNNYVRT